VQASPPPALGGWTNAARLCEAPTVKGWASGRVFGAGRGTTRKPRRQTGVFVSLPSSAKHASRAPFPLPPRYARDDAASLILDVMIKISTDSGGRLHWGEWRGGHPLSAVQLARLLKPFGVRPRLFRTGPIVARGYLLENFSDAFARYLPGGPAKPLPTNAVAGSAGCLIGDGNGGVAAPENGANPHGNCVVKGVTAQRPGALGGEGVPGRRGR
jgi:hypothetical protein